MKRKLILVLSLLIACSSASAVSAAQLTKNHVENIEAREEQNARDMVTGPSTGMAATSSSEETAADGSAPSSVISTGSPAEAADDTAGQVQQEAVAAQPESEAAQPETEAAPAETEAAQSETEAAQPETEEAQPETEAAPAETEAAQPGTEAAPAETEAAPEAEHGSMGTYLGTFTTTGYYNSHGCASADGSWPRAMHTVSTDWSVLPPGTRIRFGDSDIVYTVEDTGVHGNWVDVYYETSPEANAHGLQYKDVYLVE